MESDFGSVKTDETNLNTSSLTPEILKSEGIKTISQQPNDDSESVELTINRSNVISESGSLKLADGIVTKAPIVNEFETPAAAETIVANKSQPKEFKFPPTTVTAVHELAKSSTSADTSAPEATLLDPIEPTSYVHVTVDELSLETNSQLLAELKELEVDETTASNDFQPTSQSDTLASSIEPTAEESSEPEVIVNMRDPLSLTSSSTRPTSVILSFHDLSVMTPEFPLTESELQLGKTKPYWIPDEDCTNCMLCTTRFRVINRRHHCRCCGRVLCSGCCNLKRSLPYNDDSDKKEKVCEPCSKTLDRIIEYEQLVELGLVRGAGDEHSDAIPTTDPTIDEEPGPSSSAASRAPGLRKKSVLKIKKPEGRDPETPIERKRTVQFLDGVRPGFASDEARVSSNSVASVDNSGLTVSNLKLKKVRRPSSQKHIQKRIDEEELTLFSTTHVILIENDFHYNRTEIFSVLKRILDGERVTLAIKRNVSVNIQLSYHSLSKSKVWSCSTAGFQSIGIDEIFLAFEATDADCAAMEVAISTLEAQSKMPTVKIFPDAANHSEFQEDFETPPAEFLMIVKTAVPVQLLRLVLQIFCTALNAANDSLDQRIGIRQCGSRMERIYLIDDNTLGSHDVAGVLFSRSMGQNFGDLIAPEKASFLVGTLVKSEEIPWIQAIPNRLLLRLGNSMGCFPYPIVNPLNVKPFSLT